ncbi:hypothetical protein [Helicobacter sp.]|uniref:hypothetical protein n=1 Tax=Helicobacter sp. TaxID=218 RepID=UPI0019C4C719|nr:hypothetical protein [Helicobacter sp.]MBD5164536.1 hypothetical protein [Helicobacter sp.]
MNRANEILSLACKKAEDYLNARTKRELILLFIFCFLVGFMAVFSLSFEGAKQSLETKSQIKLRLEKELANLQDTLQTTQITDNTKSLQSSILDLEQKISLQNKQKNLLQKKSSVYALTQIADSNNLRNFTLSQEKERILLSAQGKYKDFIAFLENLESQAHLEIHHLSLYPNPLEQNLEFYAEILFYKRAERELNPTKESE